jgi:serine/threonine protein kinase/formylglycine-generating enzyme required for sulfatase activity
MDQSRTSDPVRHRRISEVFLAALRAPAEERDAFVRAACAQDESLCAEVQSLLDQAADSDGFLAQPIDLAALSAAPALEQSSAPMDRIAHFKILRVLGWGSMGVVYLARQDAPRREVALKVLRPEALSSQMRRRFAREAELLAKLSHPSIAQVYEVGITEDGGGARPWFALEFVRGKPLLEYVEAERLSVRERLELFVRICEGVHAAHEQGVVHRDLKPANLLVEAGGRPRILDFGVAHSTGGELGATLLTSTGQLVGTLAYMSPEQAAGDGRSVDRRADVYSLGVLLFELLTGELPQSTRGLELPQAVRVICEDEPTALRTLRRELDIDLETIAATALAKERERRYPGAAEMAEDVRRWLRHEPILARPPSLVYQIGKLARRNRGLVFGTVSTISALAIGLVIALLALGRTREAEAKVRVDRDEIQRLSDLRGVNVLRERAAGLWPATPERIADLEEWLREAGAISGRASAHRDYLAALERSHSAQEPRHEAARRLVRELEPFVAPESGTIATIQRRLACARDLWANTVAEHEQSWESAIAAIADRSRHPLYAGLKISPQVGLVPLGPDRESGLWEFAVFGASGRIPERHPASGRLEFDAESAIVMVLVPGGTVTLGAQPFDSGEENYDPGAGYQDGPPRPVTLAAFFLSKYELTQGQYLRVMGDNPSFWEIGDTPYDLVQVPLSPVEFIDWFQACEVARQLDLALPSEAQWERAARCGTSTAYWTGNDPEDLRCFENLQETPADALSAQRSGSERDLPADPYRAAAPVGSFAPNPFGFHDLLGNVQEWCSDPYKVGYHHFDLRAGDGLVLATSPDRDRAVRGACYMLTAGAARSAARGDSREETRTPGIGLRLARDLR